MKMNRTMRPRPGPEASRLHARSAAWLLCALSLLPWTPAARAAQPLESLEQFPRTALSIRTHSGTEWFSTWVADTPAREEQGLMYLRWLPADQGMLFPQSSPSVMTMWMKNTLIPLDMLFIDVQGRIVYIRQNATPESEEIITAHVPVKAVLELAGGLSAQRGIAVGDQVQHRLFGTAPMGPVRN
jgi:uncharacterized membrane protein (UPF0127 family)